MTHLDRSGSAAPFYRREISPFRENTGLGLSKKGCEALGRISDETLAQLRLVKALAKREERVADFDVAPPSSDPYLTGIVQIFNDPRRNLGRAELEIRLNQRFLSTMERLANEVASIPVRQIDQADLLKNEEETRMAFQIGALRSKLAAHIEVTRNELGSEISPLDFIYATMGIYPFMIGEARLETQRRRVEEALVKLGCTSYDEEGIKKFRAEAESQQPMSAADFAQTIEAYGTAYLPYVQTLIGAEVRPLPYEIITVPEDAFWLNYVEGVYNKYILKINSDPRHLQRRTEGKAKLLAIHEILGHLVQMKSWQDAIEKGTLLQCLGETDVFDSEQVALEGLAQNMHLFVPEVYASLDDKVRLEIAQDGLRQMVYNNVHVIINSEPMTPNRATKRVFDYITKYLPAEDPSEIRKQVLDRMKGPYNKTYLYAYGVGLLVHQWAVAILNPEGRARLLKLNENQPLTPAQEIKYIEALAYDNKRRYARDPNNIVSFEQYAEGETKAA